MGQKVNPIGFRLSIRRDWKSRWHAKGRAFSEMVIKDAQARRYIEGQYGQAMVSRIEIERTVKSVRLVIHAGRPGVIIGKKGEGIERLRRTMRKMFEVDEVSIDMKEIAQPETDAKLIALNIVAQLENRIMFRRAMRRALSNALRLKVEGIKIMSAGRLNGIEIARTEWYREGRVPLHTLKADIDYGFAEANTDMGKVGVKVWVSNGETYGRKKKTKYTYDDAQQMARAAQAEKTEKVEAATAATATTEKPPETIEKVEKTDAPVASAGGEDVTTG